MSVFQKMDDWYAFDDDYVRRLREGDPWTTRHFFHYFDPILTIKMRARLPSDLVEDGTHIVYVRVLEGVRDGKIRDGKAFGAYVSRTGDHVIQEQLRKKDRTDPLEDQHLDIPSPIDTDKRLVDHETEERVAKVLAALPDRERELLVRFFIREETADELCKRFQVTAEYLRVLLFRARQRFKALWEARPPGKFPPPPPKKPSADEMEKP